MAGTDLELPWDRRRWKSAYGELTAEDTVEAALPAARPALFFVTVMDRRGAVTSTECRQLDQESPS